MKRFLLTLLLFLGALFSELHGQGAPKAFHIIASQANASYQTGDNATPKEITSNVTEAEILPVEAIELYEDQSLITRSGRTITFTHRVVNAGNVDTPVSVLFENLEDNEFDFVDLKIEFMEVEETESKMRNSFEATSVTEELQLNYGEERLIVASAKVPTTVSVDQVGRLKLTVTTATQNYSVENIDEVTIIAGTVMTVEKLALETNVRQGDLLTFQIDAQNTGDVAALAVPVTVDGADQRFVVLRDEIPANTYFNSFLEVGKGTALYHINGAEHHSYTATLPEDKTAIDAIAVGYDAIAVSETFTVKFDVLIGENASGNIENVAFVSYDDGLGAELIEGASNAVTTPIPENPPAIQFFTDDTFNEETNATKVGLPLNVQAKAGTCNNDPAFIDSTLITLTSTITGDMETFLAIETERNSGAFRITPSVPTRDYVFNPVEIQNGILETTEDDELIAELTDCGTVTVTVRATVGISPKGVVFASESNRPVAGAIVRLMQLTPNGDGFDAVPADVRDFATQETVPNELVTDQEGKFEFPYVQTGLYRVEVEPPTGFNYPSILTLGQLPQSRTLDENGSFGIEFQMETSGAVSFDLPIDVNGEGAIGIEKKASRTEAEPGDFIDYTIGLTNLVSAPIYNIIVEDKPPYGFKYESGTARLDSVKIEDPMFDSSGLMTFLLDSLDGNQKRVISYRLKVGTGALNSDGINTASAYNNDLIPKTSADAEVKVDIRPGVFAQEAFVIGKVFYDKNRNKIQDADEPGVPGIRLFMENGNFIITDEEGRYSFYGISPNKHVLKLDIASLPKGSFLEVLDNRHALDPSSRFIDLHKGELHKADFAICGATDDVKLYDEIAKRREVARTFDSELDLRVNDRLRLTEQRVSSQQLKSLPASGLKDRQADKFLESWKKQLKEDETVEQYVGEEVVAGDWLPLEEVMPRMTNDLGFVDLSENDTLFFNKTTVRVKGRTGSIFNLFVNGEQIPANRIGQKTATNVAEGWAFVGIELQSGANELLVQIKDPFGNVRGSESITIFAPGDLASFELTIVDKDVPANGQAKARMNIRALDENGLLVRSRLPITLDIDYGAFVMEDLDDQLPGQQTFMSGGEATISILSPSDPTKSTISVASGEVSQEITTIFVPDLRPLIAAGIIEGTLRLRSGSVVTPISSGDAFEQELRSLSTRSNNISADARAAFFIKGKILGKYLLTAGYDSEKSGEQTLFRDIQPDQFYPVYGDASIKGFDAQSSGRLYVRVDNQRSYALWGDFLAQDVDQARSLGMYNRSMTGAKLHTENDRIKTNVFASQQSSNQAFDEFPALGVSGPYQLKFTNVVPNSEVVEIVVRDRNQPDVILSIERLRRFLDYSVEYFSGSLLFKFPVRALDEELNPRFIRVIYEAENAQTPYVVVGGDAQVKVTDNIEVGASVVEDRNPENNYRMISANAVTKLGQNTTVTTEVARTNDELQGSGNAGRVEVSHRGKNVDGRVFIGKSEAGFKNQFSTLGSGRTEAGGRGTIKIAKKTSIQAEAVHSSSDTTNQVRSGGSVMVQHSFGSYLQAQVGFRHSNVVSTIQNDATTTLRSRVTSTLPFATNAQIFGEYEQAIGDAERRVAGLGGNYQIGTRGKFYAKHEFLSSISNRYELNGQQQQNNTLIGFESTYMKNGSVFSEYRVREGMDGRSAQAAMGVRNSFQIKEGFGITAGAERIFTVAGTAINEGTSLNLGADYTANPKWKASGRGEVRFSPSGNMYLNTLGYARQINNDWTFLGNNIFSYQEAAAGDRWQERLRLGMAWRDYMTSVFNMLGRYELKREKNAPGAIGSDRRVHILSTHANWQINDDLILSGRVAAKHATEFGNGITSTSVMELISSRLTYDINARWDAGISTSLLANKDFSEKNFGTGVEAGYILIKNLRLAVGYNVFGYRERDLAEAEYTQQGPYVGFAYKFDERTFQQFGRNNDELIWLECPAPPELLTLYTPVADPKPLTILPIKPLELAPQEYLPNSVHFALAKDYLTIYSAALVDQVAQFMHRNGRYDLNLIGHTDSRNTISYNNRLSRRRSEAVMAYLLASGVEEDRMTWEAKGESTLYIEESNPVHESENRRVEFEVVPSDNFVRQVRTIEDMQVEKVDVSFNQNWNFLLASEHNVVPDRIIFDQNSFFVSKLTEVTLERLASVLDKNPEVSVVMKGYYSNAKQQRISESRMNGILQELAKLGVASTRVDFRLEESEYNPSSKKEQRLMRTVMLEYTPDDVLRVVAQTDDIQGRDANNIPEAIIRMKQLQVERKDVQVVKKSTNIRILPEALHFAFADSRIDHKTGAMIVRIASFLKNNPADTLILRGQYDLIDKLGKSKDVAHSRAMCVQDYLLKLGIPLERLVIEEPIPGKVVEVDEWTRAQNRAVAIEIRSSQPVKYVSIDYDVKPREWAMPNRDKK